MQIKFTASDVTRFWAKVDRNGPIPLHCPELGRCWIWTAYRLPNGYGYFWLDGRVRYAHIAAYILTGGDLTLEDPRIIHRCDGGALGCVRPKHLEESTQAGNIADMVAKGRQQRGEQSGKARLTENQVREIRSKHASGVRVKDLAAEYGVVHSAISSIISRRKWTHI